MTREELITTSRESGLEYYGLGKDRERFIAHITRFAELVRADEREACAKVAEQKWYEGVASVGKSIRARANT